MFGYSSGVMNFNRWSKFLEAVVRRCGSLLWTMYYDDGSLRDLAAAKGAGQMLVNTIFTKLGAPLSERKQQRLADGAEFLGLEHDVS